MATCRRLLSESILFHDVVGAVFYGYQRDADNRKRLARRVGCVGGDATDLTVRQCRRERAAA
jgi:hypothetical protein